MNLIINYNGKDKKEIDSLTRRVFSDVQNIFNIKLNGEILLFVHKNRKSFNKKLKRETPEWEVANASDFNAIDILTPDSFKKESSHEPGEFGAVLKHELAHLFINKLSNGGRIPKWLNEGLASFVAQGDDKNKKISSIYIEENFWKKMDTPKGWNEYSNFDAYRTATIFVSFLAERFSFEKIKQVIQHSTGNYSFATFNKNVKKHLGKDLDILGAEFILSVSG